MTVTREIRLATTRDATYLGNMGRRTIRDSLDWSWSPNYVLGKIESADTNVAVATSAGKIIGFAMMKYSLSHAHLQLLAIPAKKSQFGVGDELVEWLEKIALLGGTTFVYVETHIKDIEAREFYHRLGYKSVQHIPRFYNGKETAIRLAKELRVTSIPFLNNTLKSTAKYYN